MEAKSIKNHLQNDIQDSIPKFNPFWPENQTQDTSKTLPRRPHDAPRGPKTLQDVLKTPPRRPQDDPKTPPRRFKILSRRPQDGSKLPKTPQNAPKAPQDAHGHLQLPALPFLGSWAPLITHTSKLLERFVGHLATLRFLIRFSVPVWSGFCQVSTPT